MFSFTDQLKHSCELFKVLTLSCSKLILLKERNDLLFQISDRTNTEAIKMLLVIVVTPIYKDLSTFKELLEIMQGSQAPFTLSYDERSEARRVGYECRR